MMDRNKKLQSELTTLKLTLTSYTTELDALKIRYDETTRQADHQAELVRKLEDDLYKMNSAMAAVGASSSGGGGVAGASLPPNLVSEGIFFGL